MPMARVTVTLKPELLDSAGRAVCASLLRLGFDGVKDVRIGKVILIELEDGATDDIEEMCHRLLANPVIEDYAIEAIEP